MNMRDFDWLIALARERQVTGAAQELGISQSTLSRALARWEQELGTDLFVRVPDGIVPTAWGEQVLTVAQDCQSRWQRLTEDLNEVLHPERGVVRLAFLDSVATSLLPRLAGQLGVLHPQLRMHLVQEPAQDINRDLVRGVVDLALTSERPPGDIGWWPIERERLVLIVPPRHHLASRHSVSVDQLSAERLITTPQGFPHRAIVDQLFRDAGVAKKIILESADQATVEGLVAVGLGVGIVPERIAGLTGSMTVLLDSALAQRTIGLAWREDAQLPGPAVRFREMVQQLFDGAHPGSLDTYRSTP